MGKVEQRLRKEWERRKCEKREKEEIKSRFSSGTKKAKAEQDEKERERKRK